METQIVILGNQWQNTFLFRVYSRRLLKYGWQFLFVTSRGVQKCGMFFFRSSGVNSLRCNGVNLLLMTSLSF